MGNYYHFVVLPCDQHRRHTEGSGRGLRKLHITDIYARLRNRAFHSLLELNRAVGADGKAQPDPYAEASLQP